jgi:hypothetical protein
MHEQVANLWKAAAVFVVVMMSGRLVLMVVLIVGMMMVLMFDRPGGLDRLMQPAIDQDIDLGGLNAAAANAGNL